MVEIALATAVIAIGISSILVLFPIGINATRAAMEENCYSDAVETVAAFVRTKFYVAWSGNWNNDPTDPFNQDNYKTGLDSFQEKIKGEDSGLVAASEAGCYKFKRLGPEGEEIFSADVKIQVKSYGISSGDSAPIYIPDVNNDAMRSPGELAVSGGADGSLGNVFRNFAKSVLVEISWRDEVRTFRIDVYNPYFKIEPSA
jgi:hypothetical protein